MRTPATSCRSAVDGGLLAVGQAGRLAPPGKGRGSPDGRGGRVSETLARPPAPTPASPCGPQGAADRAGNLPSCSLSGASLLPVPLQWGGVGATQGDPSCTGGRSPDPAVHRPRALQRARQAGRYGGKGAMSRHQPSRGREPACRCSRPGWDQLPSGDGRALPLEGSPDRSGGLGSRDGGGDEVTFRGPLRSETTLHAEASGRREGAVWLGTPGREGGAAGGPAWGPGSQAAGRAGSEEDGARIPRARVGQDAACRRRKGAGTLEGGLGQHPPTQ